MKKSYESNKQENKNLLKDKPIGRIAETKAKIKTKTKVKAKVKAKGKAATGKAGGVGAKKSTAKKVVGPKRVKITSKGKRNQGAVEYVKGDKRSVEVGRDYEGDQRKTVRRVKKDGTIKTRSKKISDKRAARIIKRKNKTSTPSAKKVVAKKVVAKKVSARKANRQLKREEVAKTKNRSKKYDITGKEARLRVRKVKAGVKAESKNNSAKKTDRLLAKEEKIGKKLREVRKKKKK